VAHSFAFFANEWGALKLGPDEGGRPGAPQPALSLSKGLAFFETWEDGKRKEKLRYRHRDPVKRGLVGDPKSGSGVVFARMPAENPE
jgi:hypothetical protein